MKSASKLGVAQTTPGRAKSRNASAFSPHVEPHNDGIVNDPEIKAEASDLAVDRGVSEAASVIAWLCARRRDVQRSRRRGAALDRTIYVFTTADGLDPFQKYQQKPTVRTAR